MRHAELSQRRERMNADSLQLGKHLWADPRLAQKQPALQVRKAPAVGDGLASICWIFWIVPLLLYVNVCGERHGELPRQGGIGETLPILLTRVS